MCEIHWEQEIIHTILNSIKKINNNKVTTYNKTVQAEMRLMIELEFLNTI